METSNITITREWNIMNGYLRLMKRYISLLSRLDSKERKETIAKILEVGDAIKKSLEKLEQK